MCIYTNIHRYKIFLINICLYFIHYKLLHKESHEQVLLLVDILYGFHYKLFCIMILIWLCDKFLHLRMSGGGRASEELRMRHTSSSDTKKSLIVLKKIIIKPFTMEYLILSTPCLYCSILLTGNIIIYNIYNYI